LVGRQEGHPACKNMGDGGGGHWLVRMEWHPPGWSVCLPLLSSLALLSPEILFWHRSPGWSRKKGRETVVVWYEISRQPLNGFAPNSHRRRVWFVARKIMEVKVKGQESRSLGTKTAFFGPFGGLRAVYV